MQALVRMAMNWRQQANDLRGDRTINDGWEDEADDMLADQLDDCARAVIRTVSGMSTLGELCKQFATDDEDARAWGSDPDSFSEAPDCDVMSERFMAWLEEHGWASKVVKLWTFSPTETALGPHHWVVEVDGLWVDWTARQFHNIEGGLLSYDEIPCPLICVADGPYPIPTMTAERVET